MKIKQKINHIKSHIEMCISLRDIIFRKENYCNICGRPDGDGTHIQKIMGYSSDYNMDTVDLCICNECMDHIIRGCKIDPITSEIKGAKSHKIKRHKVKKTLQLIPCVLEAISPVHIENAE